MIFAHIPAGYLLADAFVKRRKWPARLLWVGMLGGTFPDIDILYDLARYGEFGGHRHSIMHYPVVWTLIAAICLVIALLRRRPNGLRVWTVFFSTVYLHFILDTAIGYIYWLAPFSWMRISVIEIPPTHTFWLWDSVLHWSFPIELVIITAAAVVFFRGGWRDLFGVRIKSKF
jgi:inner membrane protein